VMALILDEIATLPSLGLDLPMPRDPRLARICRALRLEPGSMRTLDEWAREAGASRRTIARLFTRETGLTFAGWRQQARLLAGVALLAAGEAVTQIALDLGYESPSAFAAMFRRALGAPPSRYLGGPASPVPLRVVAAPARRPALARRRRGRATGPGPWVSQRGGRGPSG
jgi:AraC-like DNA-binding protein